MLKNAEALAEDLPMSLLGKRAKGPSAPSHSSRDAAAPDLDFVVTPTKSGKSSSKSESNVPSAVRTASPRRHARARAKVNVLHIALAVLASLFLIYISVSDGSDYLHGLGKACLVVHHGWHIHLQCRAVPTPGS